VHVGQVLETAVAMAVGPRESHREAESRHTRSLFCEAHRKSVPHWALWRVLRLCSSRLKLLEATRTVSATLVA
jgi:hypothetical protein